MPNEKNPISVPDSRPPSRATSRSAASPWRHLPAIAKCIVIVPLTMALLGAEIELRLAPQLDVILTAVAVWAIWAWLAARSIPKT
jgi:hypothetical protein